MQPHVDVFGELAVIDHRLTGGAFVFDFVAFAGGTVRQEFLGKALHETVELFEKDGGCRAKISIQKEVFPELFIEMDPTHLSQVLWNLLLNAAEAIDGEGSIDLKMYSTKDRSACIEITDNGCGMSKETISSIFAPFFTTKQQGSG